VSSDAPADASAAFEALMRAHYARLCDFAVRLVHSRDIAEDIVQDVFTQLWRNRENLAVRDPLPYLYQAVRNRIISHRRRMGVRDDWRQYVTAMAAEPPDGPGAAAMVEETDLAAAYTRALSELPERCRLIFTMSREQGLVYGEIAQALGISIKTVETQIGRALKALRLRLRPYLCLAATAIWSSRLLG
jgi:RNA polymerase sigma-70 factor (family 1)